MNDYQNRINYTGDLKLFLSTVSNDYLLGEYKSHKTVLFGYEDFNVVLTTQKGKFFVKIFSSGRDKNECARYVNIMREVLKAGVSHPKLLESSQGFLYEVALDGVTDRLCILEYIDGQNLFELRYKPNDEEVRYIVKQASLINSLQIKPDFVYDSWAIVSFVKEFNEKGQFLSQEDLHLIFPFLNGFEACNIDALPHALVHGDLIKTNVMKNTQGKMYVIDFAVANYYPRIVELAVLFNSTFFDEADENVSKRFVQIVLKEYGKYISLTNDELKALPLFVKVGHAMHVLRANYEKVVNKNTSAENQHWIVLGRRGLESSQI